LKRIIITAAAVAALGAGVTVGSTHQEHGSQALPPGLTAAPQDAQTPEPLCEQAAQQLRAEHPGAYVGACHSGYGTITIP
jgi:hypothetical protein